MKLLNILFFLIPFLGSTQTQLNQVYDFDVGDEFHYRSEYGSIGIGYMVTKTIKKIISKSYSNGMVIYSIHAYGREQIPSPTAPRIFSTIISERYDTSLVYKDTIGPCRHTCPRYDSVFTDSDFGLSYTNDSSSFEFLGNLQYSNYLGRILKKEQWSSGGNPDKISEQLVYFKKDSMNWTWGTPHTFTSNISEIESLIFSVFPNPTKELIQISGLKSKQSTYIIVNSLGQMVLSGIANSSTIDCSSLTSGVYFLKIKDNQNRVGIRRIVITE